MIKKLDKKLVRNIAIILGAIIIPILYSGLYLSAFWDPYSRLKDVPVAVVNNDSGTTYNKEEVNLGDKLVDNLKKNDELKFYFKSSKEAKKGLLNGNYYATLTIPSDFSKKLLNTKYNNKIANITFSPNEKRNYLATQILTNAVEKIEVNIQQEITKDVVGTLSDNLNEVPKNLVTLNSGVSSLRNGSTELLNGTNKLKNNYKLFNKSEKKLLAGTNKYVNGVKEVNDGATKISEGACYLSGKGSDIEYLTGSINLLSTNYNTFNVKVHEYTTGATEVITNFENLATLFISIVDANPTLEGNPQILETYNSLKDSNNIVKVNALKNGGTTIYTSSALINNNLSSLNSNTSKLTDYKDGVNKLCIKTTELASGTNTLINKGGELYSSEKELTEASDKILKALSEVKYGTSNINNGNITLNNELDKKISSTKKELKKTKNLDTKTSNAVDIKKAAVEPVPNYGTAFAPYFMSLSLWIGALIIFFGLYLDTEGILNIFDRNSNRPLVRTLCYLGIGVLQGFVLALLLLVVLDLKVNNLPLFIFSINLVSIVFIAVVQFFMVILKDIGKFINILLLILQLTACGGTFPMETIPKFFQYLYPFMPMTYSVNLFKEAISGVVTTETTTSIIVLISILVVFTVLTAIFAIRSFKDKKKNH